MVKPPSTMQPEHVSRTKLDAGRKSGTSFQDDSFHNYMARKIEIQRKQFGVVLPPPPLPQEDESTTPPATPPPTTKKEKPTKKSVTFSPSTKPANDGNNDTYARRKRKPKSAMGSILKRLRRRHGDRKNRPTDESTDMGDEDEASTTHLSLSSEPAMCDSRESPGPEIPKTTRPQHESISVDSCESLSSSGFEKNEEQDAIINPRKSRPDLFFLGVVIKVNGITSPDNETLKRLIQKHGGDFETYETSRVTHLIAQQLSTAKSEMYKKQRSPRPVCLPSWIVDSVKEGRLLPHAPYILKDTLHDPHQMGISSFFGPKNIQAGPESHDPSGPRKLEFDSCTRGEVSGRQKITDDSFQNEILHDCDGECSSMNYATEESEESILQQFPSYSGCDSKISEDMKDLGLDPECHGENDHVVSGLSDLKSDRPDPDSSRTRSLSSSNTTQVDNEGSCHIPKSELEQGDEFDCEVPQTDSADCHEDQRKNWDDTSPARYAHRSLSKDPSTCDTEVKIPYLDGTEAVDGEARNKVSVRTDKQTDDKYINGRLRTVGTDPNFLESYFNSSRLSFIGSYKQRITHQSTASPPKILKSSSRLRRFVFHVDMDCFFASVVLRNFPEHRDKPVVISHHGQRTSSEATDGGGQVGSVSKTSTSECATCNYKAREFGIRKGMFLGRAIQLCPNLVVLYYDFDGYEEVSEQVLEILWRMATEYHGAVEPVSCDEAYVELNIQDDDGCGEERAGDLAELIRKEIFETTQCTASIGVASNKFLAKLGTDKVKPDASFVVNDHRELLDGLRLRDLPGIGYRSEPKLDSEGLTSVRDIWDLGHQGESTLSRVLGPGLGKKIYLFCQGLDNRQVKPAERKTIGAECNYGVRFDGPYGIDYMINGLAKELQRRMEGVDVYGRRVTLKLKQRKAGAKMPPKFLGHGSCHNHSKSMETPGSVATRDATVFSSIGMTLYLELGVPLEDVRGLGLIVSKLDHVQATELETAPKNRITNWLKKGSRNEKEKEESAGAESEDGTLRKEGEETEERSVASAKDDDTVFQELRENGDSIKRPEELSYTNTIASLSAHPKGAIEESDASVSTPPSPPREQCESFKDMEDGSSVDSPIPECELVKESSPSMTQIALPPLSQLRMSQVDALPPDMRRQIMTRIKNSENDRSSSTRQPEEGSYFDEQNEDPVMDEMEAAHLEALPNHRRATGNSPSPTNRSGTRQPTDQSPEKDLNPRFRQTSLKRLMRLAAVKSGNDSTDLSLTQLGTLPLEIQLQVANGDSRPVGDLSPRKQFLSRHSTSRKDPSSSFRRPQNELPSEGVELGPTANEKPDGKANPPFVEDQVQANQGTDETRMVDRDCEDDEVESDEEIPLVSLPRKDPRAFYRENVAPLKAFLDENSPDIEEAIETVIAFLSQCVRERQLREVVVLIRSIRNRADKWKDERIIQRVVRSLDDLHFEVYGSRLDVNWICGK